MSRCAICLTLLVLVVSAYAAPQEAAASVEEVTAKATTTEDVKKGATVNEDTMEHYPISWTKVNFKPIVDNERLFKKYKTCILSETEKGCPRDVLTVKKLVPEVLETLCAKCLPEHVEKIKEAASYICKKRPADFEEVIGIKDPSGELRRKLEDKYGKLDCDN